MKIQNRTAFAVGLSLAISVFLTGCSAPLDFPRKSSLAFANPQETTLGKQVQTLESTHPGESGFYLLSSGYDAFAARAVFINAAQRSIDAQQFIFNDDVIGNLILERLFTAADRGVRVRLLLDDWSQYGKDKRLAGINAHPNIEVRIFNPVGGWRSNPLTRPFAYIFGSARIKSRMHNKLLIVDNTIAFVGGRDIGDEYFYARANFNFHDLDLMAVGPVAHQASDAFDEYWNDSLAVPIEAFVSNKHAPAYLDEILEGFKKAGSVNQKSQYIKKLEESKLLTELFEQGKVPLVWCQGQFLYDNPAKIRMPLKQNEPDRLVAKLEEMIDSARSECLIITPYYVPGKAGIGRFEKSEARGVKVKILVNSLASTDRICTYAGFGRYRSALLADGVELYEVKPEQQVVLTRATLHTKCVVVDRKKVFVGSLNLDRRSMQMDTQDAIYAESDDLGAQAGAFFEIISANYSYRVVEDKNCKPVWIENVDGKVTQYRSEPHSSPIRRFQSWLASLYFPEMWL